MPKLYLIRRKMREFSGPMPIEELQEAYRRMSFGLEDEVAGHCGPWIVLGDMKALQFYYPSVAKVVHKELAQGWGITDHEVALGMKPSRKFGKWRLIFAVVILLTGAGGSLFYAEQKGIPVPYLDQLKQRLNKKQPLARAKELLEQKPAQFVSYMDKEWPLNQKSVLADSKRLAAWLPLLRSYAFIHGNGEIEGLSAKQLTGMASRDGGIVDCSHSSWMKRWKNFQKQQASLPEEEFEKLAARRLLYWDPHWIRRRPSSGWKQPINGYHACVRMAHKALLQYKKAGVPPLPEEDRLVVDRLNVLSLRLSHMVALIEEKVDKIEPPQVDNWYNLVTCFELAQDFEQMQVCQQNKLQDSDEQAFDIKLGWNIIRIVSGTNVEMTPELQENLELWQEQLSTATKDPLSKLSYHPEYRFLESLIKNKGARDKALSRVRLEFPHINMNP